MSKITLSEALSWKKTLEARHGELVSLRNQNSVHRTRYIGANADKPVEEKVLYDAKELDKIITGLARELRLLDMAMKKTNASTTVTDYEQNDAVLGELA